VKSRGENERVNFAQTIYKILGDVEIANMEHYWLPLQYKKKGKTSHGCNHSKGGISSSHLQTSCETCCHAASWELENLSMISEIR